MDVFDDHSISPRSDDTPRVDGGITPREVGEKVHTMSREDKKKARAAFIVVQQSRSKDDPRYKHPKLDSRELRQAMLTLTNVEYDTTEEWLWICKSVFKVEDDSKRSELSRREFIDALAHVGQTRMDTAQMEIDKAQLQEDEEDEELNDLADSVVDDHVATLLDEMGGKL